MKFLVPNYSCLQNPMTGGLPPTDLHSVCPLSPIEFVEPPPLPNKIPGYATGILFNVFVYLESHFKRRLSIRFHH